MLRHLLAFESRLLLRNGVFWIVLVVFGLFGFGMMVDDEISFGGGVGNIMRNAPAVTIVLLGSFSVLSVLLTTIFVALSSILAYCLSFPRHRLRLFLLAIPGLYGVYGFMTTARNYWDPYAAYSGLEHTLRNAESLINHYLGGVHTVAIAV